jgi:hypothetical protein
MNPEQPAATPRSGDGQARARGPEGQEATGGPTGQTPTGRKVNGQQTVQRPGANGVETAVRPADRPNR